MEDGRFLLLVFPPPLVGKRLPEDSTDSSGSMTDEVVCVFASPADGAECLVVASGGRGEEVEEVAEEPDGHKQRGHLVWEDGTVDEDQTDEADDKEPQEATDNEELARDGMANDSGEFWAEGLHAVMVGEVTTVLWPLFGDRMVFETGRSAVEVLTSAEWRWKKMWARASSGLIRLRGL